MSPQAGAGESAAGAYQELLAHAELELELAARGEIDALDALGARWQALQASLPELAPPEAAPVLARAKLVHERTRAELLQIRERLLAESATAGRAQRAARGYGSELQARVRVETSA